MTGFRTIPAAAGYPQYSGTALLPHINSDRILERFYCESIFSEITTTDYLQDAINKKGDVVTFLKEPCGIRIQDHIKDGPIEHDTLEIDECAFSLGQAKQYSLKIAHIDRYMMGDKWNRLSEMVIKNAARSMAYSIDCELMNLMATEATCANSGPHAGVVSQMYNLGQIGAPVSLTSANILEHLTHLQAVLDEQCVTEEGRFIVLPTPARSILLNSDLKNGCFINCGSGQSSQITGQVPMDIAGFKIYFSNCAPRVFDPAVNAQCYYIIAGLRQATAFASVIDETRVASGAPHNWDYFWQGLMAYGYAVIYPEALASSYVRFA